MTSFQLDDIAQLKDFILEIDLYCEKCKLKDKVRIGNTGWQGGCFPLQGAEKSQ